MSVHYQRYKLKYLLKEGVKYRVTVDKTKEKPVIVLKRVKSDTEKTSNY